MAAVAPGTFWYDFLTGPAIGSLGALVAAGVVAWSAVKVSRDRRRDADADRRADRERTRREEWFRRLQWAQQLTTSSDEDTQAAGFDVLAYLADSELATGDELGLLEQLMRTDQLDRQQELTDEVVDESDYVVDTGTNDPEEAS